MKQLLVVKLKFFLIFLLSVKLVSEVLCAGPRYTFTEGGNHSPRFADSLVVFLDSESTYQLEDILQLPPSAFAPVSNGQTIDTPTSIWTKVELTNDTKASLQLIFRFYKFVDSIWMYTFLEGEMIDAVFTGSSLRPLDKPVTSDQNSLPISLYPGETKAFYFRMFIREISCSNKCISSVRIIPEKEVYDKMNSSIAIQSFYAGTMLLFGLVSIFLFSIFREHFFLWFALLMGSFVLYFLTIYGLTEQLFNTYKAAPNGPFLSYITTSIVLCVTAFISNYLDLRSRKKKLYAFYLICAAIVCVFPLIGNIFMERWNDVALIKDRLTIAWSIICIGIIISHVRKSDKSSIILLVSVLGLFFGSLLFILGLSGFIKQNVIVSHSFQLGTVLFSGILFYGMFDKINAIRAEKAKFEELDHLKSTFFANISHEFRTPLTLVMGPIKDVLNNTKNPQDRHRLSTAYTNAERLLQLINQLLDLSKLESNKIQLYAKEQNLPEILKGITMSFESLANRKNIQFNFIAQKEHILVYVDKDKVENIFFNLLANAFKFTEEGGEVAVLVTDHHSYVEVMVRDTGVGISSERLPDIFNRFFQGENVKMHDQEGTGIGLALVKELVQLHRGEVHVESEVGKGTTFTVTFLKGTSHLEPDEIVEASEPIHESVSEPLPAFSGSTLEEQLPANLVDEVDIRDLPIVLVIEDNTAVRAYIKDFLVEAFRVVEATNGQEGIDKAFEILPDLIISDVMMPKKDGYEVCEALKTDQRTSHIPVILLTAKAASDEKLKGLETGADDYLVKPFDTRELEVRVRNLIDSRAKLRKKFSELEEFEPQSASTNKVDQAFLEKIYACVEQHLADEQFGVEFLAQEVGLSRSQLNRKLKALTDESPNRFIQSIRLQKAKALLLAGAGNVSEVAFETGFNSTAYFVKCFGDKYGQTPGSLLDQ